MKKLLLTLAVMYSAGSQAQNDTRLWAMEEPGSGTTVLMDNVSFLLASDFQDTFSIVCKDGTVVTDAQSVNFVKVDPAGISSATVANDTPQTAISADGRLSLTGCRPGTQVNIYDTGGRNVAGGVAKGERLDIDVSRLTPGIYVLKAGETTVKFIKK